MKGQAASGEQVFSANGAWHTSLGQRPRYVAAFDLEGLKARSISSVTPYGSGLQPSAFSRILVPGRCPRLVCNAPLALDTSLADRRAA